MKTNNSAVENAACKACESTNVYVVARSLLRCRSCGSVFAADIRGDEDYRRGIKEYYLCVDPAEDVAQSRLGLYRRFLTKIAPRHKPGGALLDIGCGRGDFLHLAGNEYGWSVSGIEPCEGLAAGAKQEFGLDVHNVFLEDADLPADCFDVITLWNVFDALPEPERAIAKIKRMLKSGGLLFMRLPNADFHFKMCRLAGFLSRANLGNALPRQAYVFHAANYSRAGIVCLLKRHGFKMIRVFNAPLTVGDPYKSGHAVAALKRLVYPSAQIIYCISLGRFLLAPSLEVFAEKQ